MSFGQWLGFLILIFVFYILWQIKQILLLIFTAVILANALNLLVEKGQLLGLKRGKSLLISLMLVFFAILGFFGLVVPPLAEQFQQLIQMVPKGIDLLIKYANSLEDYLAPEIIESLPTLEEITQQLQPLIQQLLGGGLNIFYSSLGVVLSLLLLLALTLMLIAEPKPYRQGFIRLFPSFYRQRVTEMLLICERELSSWLEEIFLHMGFMTILSFIVLLIVGIPLALSQAVLTGVLAFIPYIGLGLSVIPPIAIALLIKPWKAIIILILYLLIQQLENHFILPKFVPQNTIISPGFTLLAQVIFASAFGFLGLVLAVPLTIVGTVWIKEVLIKDILDQWRIIGETEELNQE